MGIPKFWRKIISSIGTLITAILTTMTMDRYYAILIIVITGIIGIWFVGYGELTKEEKQKTITKWRKYKRDDDATEQDGYFLFVGIDSKFSQKEIKILIEDGQFTEDDYKHKKTRGACL